MSVFALPPVEIDPSQLVWYHVMDLPGFGITPGLWDIRNDYPAYIGNVDLVGKSVLDVGSASGFLSFAAEWNGAREVVSFDIDVGGRQTLLPFEGSLYYQDHRLWAEQRTAHFQLWKNAYWLAHRAFGSRARVAYGDIYNLPAALGSFEVVICCAVLEHLADPIAAIGAIARHAADRMILGVHIPKETEEAIAWFLGSTDRPDDDAVFWAYSIKVYREVLTMLGFEIERVVNGEFALADGRRSPRTAVVARRVRGTPLPRAVSKLASEDVFDRDPAERSRVTSGYDALRARLRPIAHGLRSVLGTHGLVERISEIERRLGEVRLQPAVSALPNPLMAPATPQPIEGSAPAPIDVNVLLHQSRSAMLRSIPAGARRLLSAGCAGAWYFDWIEQTYGPVDEHLGIEYYAERPATLPDNVTWIANTASNMSGVADQTCDLVFSGQNLEHLWPEEVAGFMLEAARVLRPGGRLVVDSPNRLLTAPLGWSHPEHTIELTPAEASRLLSLSGFDVAALKGIWLCRDAKRNRLLSFDPNVADTDWSVTERLITAQDRPDDSFIWWIEGLRTGRAPDRKGVEDLMADLFRQHWPERVQRLIVPGVRASRRVGDGVWIAVASAAPGIVFFGPYLPLRAGRYRCSWRFGENAEASAAFAVCDVLAQGHETPLAETQVAPGQLEVALEFDLAATTFGIQFRCASLGTAGFEVLRRVELQTLDQRV